jgi:hypothetical protein
VKADWNDFAALLDEQAAVGDELRRNLAAQRQALVAWDMEALIAGIDARESYLRSLDELERRRIAVLEQAGVTDTSFQLKQLIAQIPDGLPVRRRLQTARARALETFTRLQADERNLNSFMASLLEHLRDAVSPLARSDVSLYDDTGAAALQGPVSAFIRNRV